MTKQKPQYIAEIPERIKLIVLYNLDSSVREICTGIQVPDLTEEKVNFLAEQLRGITKESDRERVKEIHEKFRKYSRLNDKILSIGADLVTLNWRLGDYYTYRKLEDFGREYGFEGQQPGVQRLLDYLLINIEFYPRKHSERLIKTPEIL